MDLTSIQSHIGLPSCTISFQGKKIQEVEHVWHVGIKSRAYRLEILRNQDLLALCKSQEPRGLLPCLGSSCKNP